MQSILPLLLLLLAADCRFVNRSNMPAEQKQAQARDSSTDHISINTSDTASSFATKFGVMVAKSGGMNILPQKQAQIVKALGVNYTRAKIDIQTWNGSSNACDTYIAAGLKFLLNVNYAVPRNAAGDHDPVPFPTDMAAYSTSLNSILDKYKPEVLVVENEEDNPLYHSGTADDYLNELKTAIDIAHKKGIKVTNGGITVREVCLIVYDDLMQKGRKKEAMDFVTKAAPPALIQRVQNTGNKMIQRQIEFGRKILAAYKTLDLDYVNFHWYEPVKARGKGGDADFNPEVFSYVADYIKTATGKPVMSNEFGVLNPSPELVKNVLQSVRSAGLVYGIFYSADGGTEGSGKAVALQDAGGNLKDNGIAFRDFMKQAHE
ncbi:hypothetical protein [Parafilimonas sp.]|uniref:hypothetical protein n=1 Tax=Parafilimonas sp. TaxID=1969739 RepID=UPI0039E551E2